MRSVSQVLVLVALAACATPAAAQPRPAPTGAAAPATPPQPGKQPAAAPSLPAASAPDAKGAAAQAPADAKGAAVTQAPAGTDAPQKPPSIDVEDPLLAPVPPAPHTITGFREVLSLLSNESLTLRIAQQDIERAKGQERTALAGVLPSVNGSASVTATPWRELGCEPAESTVCAFQAISQRQLSTSQAQVRVSQPFSARAWYAVGTAGKSVDATKLRAEDARRQAIAASASTIVSVVTAERVAEINRVALKASLQRLELTKRRKRLGSGTDLDIVRAEQDAATSRSQLVGGDENLRKARESLGQLFGKSDGYGVPTTFTLDDIEPALKSACKVAKPDERTDVLAAKADLEVAKRGVTDVKLGFLPTLELSTTLSTSSTQTERASALLFTPPVGDPVAIPKTDVIAQQTSIWSIGALLTVPIWDGGARYGQMKTANANVEQAKTRVEQATVTATLEATQSQRAIHVAEQARTLSEKARDLARETARLSQVAFESGAGTSLDLIDSGRVLRQAELDLAVKELEVVRAKIAALLALSACNL